MCTGRATGGRWTRSGGGGGVVVVSVDAKYILIRSPRTPERSLLKLTDPGWEKVDALAEQLNWVSLMFAFCLLSRVLSDKMDKWISKWNQTCFNFLNGSFCTRNGIN